MGDRAEAVNGLACMSSSRREQLKSFYDLLFGERLADIVSESLDMWPVYIKAKRNAIAEADHKMAFDRSHVTQSMG